jgi:hypothetical protein
VYLVRNESLWNSLILGWVVIAYPFMPTRHNYWMIEHIQVPAKRLEAIQTCCRYITRALILLTCRLCSFVYSDEVANLCASISNLLILSVAYIISDVAHSYALAEKEEGEHKLLNRLQKNILAGGRPFSSSSSPISSRGLQECYLFLGCQANLSLS